MSIFYIDLFKYKIGGKSTPQSPKRANVELLTFESADLLKESGPFSKLLGIQKEHTFIKVEKYIFNFCILFWNYIISLKIYVITYTRVLCL